MNTPHVCTTTAHPRYCPKHHHDYYPHTCGHSRNCPDCDLDAAVEAARAALPQAVNERLEKAAELVRVGHVYLASGFAAVKSQRSERIYQVGAAGCFCEDAQYRAPEIAGLPACKHQIAVWLKQKMNEPQTFAASEARAVAADSHGSGIKRIEEQWCPLCKKTTWRHRDGRCIHCWQTDEAARRGPRAQDWSWAR